MLQRMYGHGRSLHETLLTMTSATAVGRQLSACLITPTDSSEYAEILMGKTFAAENAQSPAIVENVRLEQQSSQGEVTVRCTPKFL